MEGGWPDGSPAQTQEALRASMSADLGVSHASPLCIGGSWVTLHLSDPASPSLTEGGTEARGSSSGEGSRCTPLLHPKGDRVGCGGSGWTGWGWGKTFPRMAEEDEDHPLLLSSTLRRNSGSLKKSRIRGVFEMRGPEAHPTSLSPQATCRGPVVSPAPRRDQLRCRELGPQAVCRRRVGSPWWAAWVGLQWDFRA